MLRFFFVVNFCSLLFVVFVFVFVCYYCLSYFFLCCFCDATDKPTAKISGCAALFLPALLRLLLLLCCCSIRFAPPRAFFGFTAASASFHCAALYNTLIQREPIFNLTFFVAVLNFRPHAFTLTFVCGGGTHRVAYTAAAAVLPNGSNTGRCCAAHNLRKFEINKGGTWERRRQSMEQQQQQQYQVGNSCKIKQKIITKWNKHFYVTISISISLALQPMSYCILCFPLDFRCLLVFFLAYFCAPFHTSAHIQRQ